ncbi:MAG: hypothetical protein DRI71_06935 [Bacteroidetes bacterium]|nr:MAG: hypothetical protein DRI71_06935 [Bacteroidota bacterium]
MNNKRIKVILISMLLSGQALAQGCSDAGFCTMGAMKPDQAYSNKIDFKLRSVEISYYKGNTTTTAEVAVTNLDISLGITEKTGFQIKLPYQWTSGTLGKAAGMGDVSLSITHNVKRFNKFELNATLGMKIPSNKSDIQSQGRNRPFSIGLVLPMYYQVSLGSWDMIAGASLINENWLFAIGYQNALTANNNTFEQDDWAPPVYPSESYVASYDEATKLKRGSDIMFRVERNFRFARYNFNVGLLPIYRISKDRIIDEATNEYKKLDDTTGLALSLLAGFGYNFNINNTVKFTYGKKLVQRDVNPDGLTRTEVMIIAYLFRF